MALIDYVVIGTLLAVVLGNLVYIFLEMRRRQAIEERFEAIEKRLPVIEKLADVARGRTGAAPQAPRPAGGTGFGASVSARPAAGHKAADDAIAKLSARLDEAHRLLEEHGTAIARLKPAAEAVEPARAGGQASGASPPAQPGSAVQAAPGAAEAQTVAELVESQPAAEAAEVRPAARPASARPEADDRSLAEVLEGGAAGVPAEPAGSAAPPAGVPAPGPAQPAEPIRPSVFDALRKQADGKKSDLKSKADALRAHAAKAFRERLDREKEPIGRIRAMVEGLLGVVGSPDFGEIARHEDDPLAKAALDQLGTIKRQCEGFRKRLPDAAAVESLPEIPCDLPEPEKTHDRLKLGRSGEPVPEKELAERFRQELAERAGQLLAEYQADLRQRTTYGDLAVLDEEVQRHLPSQAFMLIEQMEEVADKTGADGEPGLKAWCDKHFRPLRDAVALAAGLVEVRPREGEDFDDSLHEISGARRNADPEASSSGLRIYRVLKPGYRLGPKSATPKRKAMVEVYT